MAQQIIDTTTPQPNGKIGDTAKVAFGKVNDNFTELYNSRTAAMSFRNKLINAAFTVNQRGYASGAATAAANQYTLDRWRVVTSGQALSWSGTAPNITITAPAGGVEQVIEGIWIEGGTYTLSWTGTATATVNGSAVANGGQVTLPAGANATVRFSGGTVSKPQLELGPYATQFEHRPYGLELTLCQRYFERVLIPQDHAVTFGQAYSATLVGFTLTPKVTMRAAPTFSGSNLSAVTATGTYAAITSIDTIRATPGFVNLNGNTSGLTAGNASGIAGGLGGGEYSLSAEL